MPTSFTAPVEDGEITHVADYLQRCAGAFFYQFRDELPLGAPVPEFEIYPADGEGYERERITEYLNERDELIRMTGNEIVAKITRENEDRRARDRADDDRNKVYRDRYAAMRKAVEKWKPPTKKHEKLKEFALQQIDDSARSVRCRANERSYPDPQAPEQWRDEQLQFVERMIKSTREDIENRHLTSIQNKEYADALRDSIEKLRK